MGENAMQLLLNSDGGLHLLFKGSLPSVGSWFLTTGSPFVRAFQAI